MQPSACVIRPPGQPGFEADTSFAVPGAAGDRVFAIIASLGLGLAGIACGGDIPVLAGH